MLLAMKNSVFYFASSKLAAAPLKYPVRSLTLELYVPLIRVNSKHQESGGWEMCMKCENTKTWTSPPRESIGVNLSRVGLSVNKTLNFNY